MFARRTKILGFLLGLGDLAVVAVAFQIAYLIRFSIPGVRPFFLAPAVSIGLLAGALFIWGTAGAALGVYQRFEVHDPLRIFKNTVKQAAIASAAFTCLIYLLKEDISRAFILLFGVLAPVLLLIYRLSGRRMHRMLRRDLIGQVHFVIVGTSSEAVEMARMIEAGADLGNRILAFVRERPTGELPADAALQRTYPLRDLTDLPAMLRDHVVDEVIFAVSKRDLETIVQEDIFLACEEEGVKTRILVNFLPRLHSEMYLEKLQNVPLLTFGSTPDNEYLLFLKRLFDTAFSAFLLVVLSPFFLLIAILIKLTSKGPAVYSQIRCGLNGRRFRLYKFRSMYEDAEARRSEVQHLNELDGPVFKSKVDPRITPLGAYLRRMSLDEWPQLINIIKGQMSFVGPRPPLPQEVEQYERWQRRRLRMKPGLTCLWALEGRNQLDFSRWMRLDIDYIEQWSLLLDFKILFRTIPRVLSGRGAS